MPKIPNNYDSMVQECFALDAIMKHPEATLRTSLSSEDKRQVLLRVLNKLAKRSRIIVEVPLDKAETLECSHCEFDVQFTLAGCELYDVRNKRTAKKPVIPKISTKEGE